MNSENESKDGYVTVIVRGKEYVPIKEVVREVGVDLQSISRWIKKGKIPKPHKDRAGRRFYPKDQIEQIIEQIKAYYSLMLSPDPGPPAEGGQQQSTVAQINPRGDHINAQG
jgi:predicted DNA-binding transcriptional regulator AlpA